MCLTTAPDRCRYLYCTYNRSLTLAWLAEHKRALKSCTCLDLHFLSCCAARQESVCLHLGYRTGIYSCLNRNRNTPRYARQAHQQRKKTMQGNSLAHLYLGTAKQTHLRGVRLKFLSSCDSSDIPRRTPAGLRPLRGGCPAPPAGLAPPARPLPWRPSSRPSSPLPTAVHRRLR